LPIAAEADWVEIDVHLSEDGEVVVIHDATVDRCTDGQGPVSARSLAELKALDAGAWFGPAFVGTGIPTLAKVVTEFNGKAGLLIEIKEGKEGPYPGIESAIAAVVRAEGDPARTVVQSFHAGALLWMAEVAPEVARHRLLIGK